MVVTITARYADDVQLWSWWKEAVNEATHEAITAPSVEGRVVTVGPDQSAGESALLSAISVPSYFSSD